MPKTIIVNYLGLDNVGGIEKYIYKLAKYVVSQEGRFIWLCDETPRVAESFKHIMLGDGVQRIVVKCRKFHWFEHEPICFQAGEEAVVITFRPLDMAMAEQLVYEYPEHCISPFYAVPNTTGNYYYLERFFSGKLRERILDRMGQIIKRWDSTGHVRFFSTTQISPLEENYGFKVCDPKAKVLKAVADIPMLDEQQLDIRMKRNTFNLITVGRFDFPHKGYILGLIRAFGRLKRKYPKLTLTVIGFGPGKPDVLREIGSLDPAYQKDICLLGQVSPDDLGEYMKNAHLNISVAGAVGDGAKNGVLSIPARNWCRGECEVYGFLPESRLKATSSEPGELVDPYIEQVINMSDEEYRRRCVDSYMTYKVNDVDPLYFVHASDKCDKFIADPKDIHYMKKLSYLVKLMAYGEVLRKKLKMR